MFNFGDRDLTLTRRETSFVCSHPMMIHCALALGECNEAASTLMSEHQLTASRRALAATH